MDIMTPIFLLAGGARTGSTLLQRLLISTSRVLIWGEHDGALLPPFRHMLDRLRPWLKQEGNPKRKLFLKEGYDAWIPNMTPDLPDFVAGCREFLNRSFARTAALMGYMRWGFKEIRYGKEDALFLQTLYPEARFVFLVRDPKDCLQSIKSAAWYQKDHQSDPDRFMQIWAKLSGEFSDLSKQLQNSCLVRYEELISSSEEVLKTISATCEIPVRLFDRRVFESVHRGNVKTPASLDERDRRALAHDLVSRSADMLGYTID